MQRNDYEYFRRREKDERLNAERAQDLTARHAHLAMADRYAERHRAMMPQPGLNAA